MTTDFLVIGGGVAGLGAGAALAAHGRVVLLEAESALGYHASGRSAALYEAQYGLPTTIALNIASGDAHRDGGYLSPRGLMLLAGTADAEDFQAEARAMHLDPVGVDEAVRMVPVLDPAAVAFAGHHEGAWDIDTDKLLQDYARTIRHAGGQVLTSRRVSAIRRTAVGWAVDAGGETYEARILVNAGGAWADGVAAMAGIDPIGIVARRRSMARLPAPGGHDVRGWPMLLGIRESWYAKPDAGKLLVSPADEDVVEPHDAWAEDMVLAEGLARYEAMVTVPVTRVETSWAGLRSFAPDRTLVLGPDPDEPAFVWCAGQGGYGFQTAPAASRLLADLVTGDAPELEPDVVAALEPDRLRR